MMRISSFLPLFSRRLATRACLAGLILATVAMPLRAAQLFWDGDGAGTVAGGTGTWDTTLARWSTTAGGSTYQAWVNGTDDAVFQNAFGTVTASVPIQVRSMTFGHNYTLQGSTITMANGGTGAITANTFSPIIGNVIAGTVGLTKLGTGTLFLTGANTYTGTTFVSAGELRVNGSLSAGTTVNVAAGAVLGGGGTLNGALVLQMGGKLSPGDGANTIGTLTLAGGATWNGSNDGSATIVYDLDSGGVGDKVEVTGNFLKGSGTTFKFDFNGTGGAGTYTLVHITGGMQDFSPGDITYVNLASGLSASFDLSSPTNIKLIVASDQAPTVSISAPSLLATNTGPVTYTVTYVDDNFDSSSLSTDNISLLSTGSASGSVSVSPGSGNVRTVTISNISGNGTLSISILPGTGVDLAGHTASGGGPSTAFAVDNTLPVMSSADTVNGAYQVAFAYPVQASETVTFSATGLPTGLAIDSVTGLISGTPTAVGAFVVQLRATDGAGNVATKPMTINIAPKQIVLSGLAVQTRPYDGTTVATLVSTDAVLTGVYGPDIGNITFSLAGATATFADANVGTGKPVTVTGIILIGPVATNYVLAAPIVTGTITGQAAAVTLQNLTQTYNGTPRPVTVTTNPAGLNVSVTYNGIATAPTNAGTYNVIANVADASFGGQAVGVLTIAKASQTINFAALPDKQVTDTPFAVNATATSSMPVTFTVTGPVALSGGNTLTITGEGTVTVTAHQSGDSNYSAAPDVVRTFAVTNLPQPGVYFGTFAGDRADAAFGLIVRPDKTGVFAGVLPTLGIGLFTNGIVLDQNGSFSSTFKPFGSTITVTVRGRVSGSGAVTGNVDPFAITFAGTTAGPITTLGDETHGPAIAASAREGAASGESTLAAGAPVSGLYQVVAVGTAGTTTVTVFAGADGRAYVFTTDGTRATGAATTISNAGVLSVTLPDQSRVALTFAADGTTTGTLTPTSGVATTITGGAEAVASTQRMLNMSARGRTGSGDAVLIAGFVINGASPKRVVVRVAGPILTNFGVNNVLANPNLTIKNSAGTVVATNDDWGAQNPANPDIAVQMLQAGGFPFGAASKDAAIVLRLAPGPYTVLAGGGDGTVLTEVYELLDTGEAPAAKKIVNFSARGQVGVANEPLTAGFVIAGNVPKRVLIRGIGPTIASVLPGAIANPRVRVFDSNSTKLAENDDWFRDANATQISAAAASVGAFPLGAQGLDAALLIVLQPGAYTAVVDDASGGTGLGLVEVYEVP